MSRHINFLTGKWVEDKPRRKNANTEEKVKDAILLHLKSKGCYVRTIKSDGRKLPNGKWIPSKQGRGISDIIGVYPGGRFIAVEVKSPGKEKSATPEQIEFLRQIILLGGIGVVASSTEQVDWACVVSKETLLNVLPAARTESKIPQEELQF
jgi:hypothetical protein